MENSRTVTPTLKHIPVTKAGWLAEVDGVLRFITAQPRLLDDNGQAWLDSMRSYYHRRLQDLAAHPPEGMTKRAAASRVWRVMRQLHPQGD